MVASTTRKANSKGAEEGDTAAEAASTEDKDAGERAETSGTAYLNVTTSPMTYDRDGRMVAAGEWTPEVNLDAIGKAARSAGHLLPRSAL